MRLVVFADSIDSEFVRALQAGAVPVVPATAEFQQLLGQDWPYFAGNEELAIKYGWSLLSNTTVHNLRKKLQCLTW